MVEVDGLEGDDEFFVQSTTFGVAYRVIGGLGSDTINVTGDVIEDIVTRELEGVSGTIDHRVTSPTRPRSTTACRSTGSTTTSPRRTSASSSSTETGAGTTVREGGSPRGPVDNLDSLLGPAGRRPGPRHGRLRHGLGRALAAGRGRRRVREPGAEPGISDSLDDGEADTIWLCTGTGGGDDCTTPTEFQRYKLVNGVLVDETGRALVLTFTGGNCRDVERPTSCVYVYAVDDPRSEGDRVVVVQHSTISDNPHVRPASQVRNVEVMLRDNDTPGVYVTQVTPGTNERTSARS